MKLLAAVLISLVLGACGGSADPGGVPSLPGDAGSCDDNDNDGYGEGCDLGGDCDDTDDQIHAGCSECTYPQQGCECPADQKPVSCFLTPSENDQGAVMCREGTRYCRDGAWSACETIFTYPRPEASAQQALINPDAGIQHCTDCAVQCYVIRDNLDPVADGGLKGTATNISSPDGGGITLSFTKPDAAAWDGGVVAPPIGSCILNTAPDADCDGILDIYDPYPNQKPFETTNSAIFLGIKPGETGVGNVDLQFYLNSADVYFLVDQTASMDGERAQLKKDLVSGDFINDASYDCGDYDFDGVPNNELKKGGIVGAVRCIIREANFGIGYFREIPFTPAANIDSVTFRNLQDVTSSIPLVTAGVAGLITAGNIDWPEADTLALNLLATGNGFYYGTTRPGVLPRVGCPDNTFGYPCFRGNAIPIVLMFTDAPLHNGPPDNTQPYTLSSLGIPAAGTNGKYTPLPITNETYATAYDLGDVTTSINTYIGTTDQMKADFPAAAISCGGTDGTSPDAVVKFSLTAKKTVLATTDGSDTDTVLAIFAGAPTAATQLPTITASNDTNASAYSYGTINNKYVQASGNSSGLVSDFSATDVACNSAATAKDATFKFTLTDPTKVSLDTSGSSYGTAIALFSGTPVANTYTNSTNTNDTMASAQSFLSINGNNRGIIGNTNTAGITASYAGNQLGCATAAVPANMSPDAVYNFSLTQDTRVRITTEDSSFPAVIALTDNGAAYGVMTSLPNTNEAEVSARDVGVIDGTSYVYTGDTAGMASDYLAAVTACSSSDSGKDATFKFAVNSTREVKLDTFNSAFDTTLSLFRTNITPTVVDASTRTNEIGSNALNVGTINYRGYTTTNASTAGMTADYTTTQTGCSSNTSSPDAAYKFHLDTATKVRIDVSGTTYKSVVSLHSALPDAPVTATAVTGNDTVPQAKVVSPTTSDPYQSYGGSTSTFAANVPITSCAAATTSKDATFQLNIATAGTYEINTTGSGFDTVLGLYSSALSGVDQPAATAVAGAGDKLAGATDIGVMDDRWVSYSGTSASATPDFGASSLGWSSYNCTAATGAADVFYKFTLSSARTIVIDTAGSSYDTVVALINPLGVAAACNNDVGTVKQAKLTTASLAAGTYYIVVKGKAATDKGAYNITVKDNSLVTSCDDNSGGGVISKLTATLAVGTYNVIVKGAAAADAGTYQLNVKYTQGISTANQLQCATSTTTSRIDRDLTAGDYYVVVKSSTAAGSGDYTLKISDLTYPLYMTCNDDTSPVKQSSLTATLTPGIYYAVVKSKSATVSGAYQFNIRDNTLTLATNLQCDYNSGPNGTARIERDLAAGNYRVVVKGKAATDKGAYKLIVRDLTQLPPNRLACDNNSGFSGASRIDTDLAAGTYTVVLKGDSALGAGNYKLSLRDATKISANDVSSYCNDDYLTKDTSTLSQALDPGTYYAVVKGKKASAKGVYQLTVGGGTAVTGTSFSPPTWAQTLAALKARNMRVMTVLSCQNDTAHGDLINGDCKIARTQAKALANSTGALGSSLNPLVFDIDTDGDGLSRNVVDGIAQLANYLEMNVSARVVFEPDANPGFAVQVVAIDKAGDGCSGLVGAEHQHCKPGAAPKFEVRFTNPLGAPVPSNKNDPKGGYTFRAELIGDSQFVLDKVPVYIIPQDVIAMPPATVPVVATKGTYRQDIKAKTCGGTTRPDWHDLTWTAAVPDGTSVTFSACASDKVADLATCTPNRIVGITGGRSCKTDIECVSGFCSTEKNCQFVTGSSCSTTSDCTTVQASSTCVSGTCVIKGQPVYAGPALATGNFTSNLRMSIDMTGNAITNASPTVRDWSLTYLCNSAL